MGSRKLEKGGKIRKRGLSAKSLFANSFCSENGAFFPGFEEDHLDLKALQIIAILHFPSLASLYCPEQTNLLMKRLFFCVVYVLSDRCSAMPVLSILCAPFRSLFVDKQPFISKWVSASNKKILTCGEWKPPPDSPYRVCSTGYISRDSQQVIRLPSVESSK